MDVLIHFLFHAWPLTSAHKPFGDKSTQMGSQAAYR